MIVLSWLARTAKAAFVSDDVCRDWGAVRYVRYKGELVRAVPVADAADPSRIVQWVESPEDVQRVDAIKGAAARPPAPSSPSGTCAVPDTPVTPPAPSVNPAAIPGL